MTGNIVIFVTDQRQSNLAACLPGKIPTGLETGSGKGRGAESAG